MLGNAVEARTEFAQIRADSRSHPEVLDFEWRLLAQERRWTEAVDVGERLIEASPDDANAWVHRSYALHELRRTHEAYYQLLPAIDRFPREMIIPYNLACYTCQLGDLPAARAWLERALAMSKGSPQKLLRLQSAVEDADLQPLWPELKTRIVAMQSDAEV